jgi:hypothetical protein
MCVDEEAVLTAAARRSVRVYGAGAYRANPRHGAPASLLGSGGLCESDMPEAVRQPALAIAECRNTGKDN